MFRRQKPVVEAPVAAPIAPVVPRVPVDPYLGSERARVLHRAALDGQLGALGPLLSAAVTPQERGWLIAVLAHDPSLADTLKNWALADPRSVDAATARGASMAVQALALGGPSGTAVPPEHLGAFASMLREADRVLLQAATLSPAAQAPWVWLLHTGRGLRISTHELRLRYEHAVRDQGVSFDAAEALLLALSPPGSGTHDEMVAFARDVADAAPDGSVLTVLPVLAHIGRAVADGGDFGSAMAAVLPHLATAASRSVDHPSFVDDSADSARARNIMCCAFGFAGDAEAAGRQRAAIGGRLHVSPWHLLGDPESVYQALFSSL